jgi:VIT1/CCC1 family predicted Fe2+/Mn2+ transporter
VGYVFNSVFQFNPAALFYGTALATLFALFVVGAVKGRLIHGKWVLAGLETMMIGGIAATIAYVVGFLLRNIN